jgi:hypothetical protein
MASEGWSPGQAEAWLVAAGTASSYEGLYNTVRTYRRPTAGQLPDFPETARVSGLVDAMVNVHV